VNGRADGKYSSPEHDEEAASTECPICAEELYVVVEFKNAVPLRVLSVGRESEWPKQYMEWVSDPKYRPPG
jgi:hypothetical protein